MIHQLSCCQTFQLYCACLLVLAHTAILTFISYIQCLKYVNLVKNQNLGVTFLWIIYYTCIRIALEFRFHG